MTELFRLPIHPFAHGPRHLAAVLALTGICALAAMPATAGDPHFVDRSAALPVQQVYSGGWEHFVGGGVAILDCNEDGYPDIYAAGGDSPARLFVNTTAHPGDDLTFRLGDGVPALTGVTGAYPLDIDGDGWLDLMVLRVGRNVALKGGPGCRFTDATAKWGLEDHDQWTTAFSATWEKGPDGSPNRWPTIAIGNYVDRFDPKGPFFACDRSWVQRPAEDGGFAPPQAMAPSFCPLSMLISDWTHDGKPDLRVSNDRQYYVRNGWEQMFHLNPLREYSPAEGWKHVSLWGMGIASRDINGDGWPEVMMTSMGDQLLQYNDDGKLTDVPYTLGTYAQRPFRGDDGRPSTGWHAEFADVDNDGRADLFIAKGNVDQMPSNAIRDPNNLLMQQPDGHFVEKATVAGIDTMQRSRGAGLVDLNRDGRLDLVVINRRAPMELWQNATPGTGHWLNVELHQDGGNSRAVGSWVELTTAAGPQWQELTVGGGHASGHATGLHFGLGPAPTGRLRVTWPDGTQGPWMTVSADRYLVVQRHPPVPSQ